MEDEELYSMKLHDEKELWSNLYVMRVPGGWIYRQDTEQAGGHWMTSATFVPFSDEFNAMNNAEK